MQDEDLEILARETVFRGYFRVERLTCRHRRHDGGWTEPYLREVFERGHAVAVLPFDLANDRVVLIEQLRAPRLLAGLPARELAIVAGAIDAGETPADVAHRELLEEAGLTAQDLAELFLQTPSPGCSSETIRIYVALVDASQAGGYHGLAEEQEEIRVLAMPAQEAFRWVAEGRIENATALLALQWLQLHHAELRQAGGLQGIAPVR